MNNSPKYQIIGVSSYRPESSGSVTVGANQIAYGDNLGEITSDANHTLLADGTLNLEATIGNITGSFVQKTEPSLANLPLWGTQTVNNITGASTRTAIVDGTSIPDIGNDTAGVTIIGFPATGVGYQHFITSTGSELRVDTNTTNFTESITQNGYDAMFSDGTSGGRTIMDTNGISITSTSDSSPSAFNSGAFYGRTVVDTNGAYTKVTTGKSITDFAQSGTSISSVAFTGSGLNDFIPAGTYEGSFTGNYLITCIGNSGSRVGFDGGMSTGQQFDVGEVVTGSISGSTAVVSEGVSDVRIWAYNMDIGFVLGDVLTGSNGNVSTPVTVISNDPYTGDLFQVNYTDALNVNIQWFTGNQANPSPFVGMAGISYEFSVTPTGHMPNDTWEFTASAVYATLYHADIDGVATGDIDNLLSGTKSTVDLSGNIINEILGAGAIYSVSNSNGDPYIYARETDGLVWIGDVNGIRTAVGVKIDAGSGVITVGDTFGNNTRFTVDKVNDATNFVGSGNAPYLTLDGANQLFKLGRISGGNSTHTEYDDTNQTAISYSGGVNKNIVASKTKSLPDNTATSVFEVALPAGGMTGGFFTVTITATDGTDLQVHSDHVTYSAVNKGGSYTTAIQSSNGDDAVANSSGTLAVSWSITTGTNKIIIQVNANSSLTSPTIELVGLNIDNNNGHAVTIL